MKKTESKKSRDTVALSQLEVIKISNISANSIKKGDHWKPYSLA
jgi:hypothetical protein